MRKALPLIAIMTAVAACGGGSDSATGTDEAENSATGAADGDAFISGTASGATESDFALAGVFKCEDQGSSDGMIAEIIGTGAQSEQLAISLPYSAGGVGSFELIGSDDARYATEAQQEIRYRSTERTTYDSGSGTLTITAWPAAASEPVEGTFTASLSKDDETVEIEGTISGSALSQDFACTG